MSLLSQAVQDLPESGTDGSGREVMYDCTRDQAAMPEHAKDADSGYGQVEEAIIEAGGNPRDRPELEIATVATWCAAHGVAEMLGLKQFEPLKQALGGEEALARALLGHVTAYKGGVAPGCGMERGRSNGADRCRDPLMRPARFLMPPTLSARMVHR